MPTAIFDDFEKVARNLAGKPQDTLEDEGKV
jgi:hypothetical protein